MTRHLADLGKFNSVAIIAIVAASASVVVTASALALLGLAGIEAPTGVALAFSAGVPLVVSPPIAWLLVGLLLQSFRQQESLRKLASTDSLTGLLSRHAFIEAANNHISLADRNGSTFVVLLVDLDHFKSINDRYGHPAGDAVLKLFADVLNSVARRSDIAGRLGGEEFALLLPETGTDEALEFAGRLHRAIGQAVLKYGDGAIHYTASMGLACSASSQEKDLDSLLARADMALYAAKHGGRNQTRVFDETRNQAATG
ncbi:MAG: GGDEF domain-containing protein [Gammaproteobacteria bacterium]|jgi:diguanylate cyclase (GGDEF)-like protein